LSCSSFWDEFIDGICAEVGKTTVQQLLKENGNKFYLNITNKENGHPELKYSFDLLKLTPGSLWK
jgi:hypothetical protein